MPDAAVTFDGLDEAARDMARWADQLAGKVAKDAAPFGETVAGRVRDVVPVLTGALAGSVGTADVPEGVEVGYDGSVAYDAWIEFGGVRGRPIIPGGRYLYPAALESEPDFMDVAEKAAEDSIEEFAWTQRH